MNSKPLVSSVISFLNAEKFIEEAIESVVAQTYDYWELLLVDDGSTDDSTQFALRYAERFPEKIRYLEHPGHQNRGLSASRNLGISQAKGEYINFLDADDVWFSHTLEQQVAILSSHPEAGMVYGSSLYWFSWTGNPEDIQRDFRDFVEECGVQPNTLIEPPELLRVFLRRDKGPCVFGSVPAPSSLIVRREVARSVGGFEEQFHQARAQFEDRAFYVKVGLEVPVLAASECWCKYRQHPDSITYIGQKTDQHLPAQLFWLNWIAEQFFERGIEDAGIWKLLQEAQLHTHNRQIRKLERALTKERREHIRQLKRLERALEKERQEVRQLRLQIVDMNGQGQNRLSYKVRELLERFVGHLRAKASSR
jgi:glycosyltransferase involved in cell wall biosynthesis